MMELLNLTMSQFMREVITNFTYTARNPNAKFILDNIGIDTELLTVRVKPNCHRPEV